MPARNSVDLNAHPSIQTNSDLAVVNYQLSATTTSPQPIQWTSGAMSFTTLGFDGYQNANDIMRSHFETNINQVMELMTPASLGAVGVVAKKYDAADLVLTLAPTSKSAALSLSGVTGSINGSGTNLQIQVIINKTIPVVGKWRNQLAMNIGQAYNARLVLNLSALTNGITLAMLQQLPKTNGVVVISDSSNVDFYNMIIANLQNALQVQIG